ncbi:MAG: hypothetical protein LBS59_07325, partial [Puniceicoccales bacterium]|nr:hypothetical protein [Puniceicoccales bacterium]
PLWGFGFAVAQHPGRCPGLTSGRAVGAGERECVVGVDVRGGSEAAAHNQGLELRPFRARVVVVGRIRRFRARCARAPPAVIPVGAPSGQRK